MLLIAILIVLALIATTTWIRNADVFSPVKIGLAYMVLYFEPIFSTECDYRLHLLYLGLLGVLYTAARREPIITPRDWVQTPRGNTEPIDRWFAFTIVSLCALTIAAVGYKMHDAITMGGIRELAVATKLKVSGIRGLEGSYLRVILFELIPYLNLAFYLILFATNRLHSKSWKILFLCHLAIVSGMGILSLSRGGAFLPLVSYLILRNYCERKVSPFLAASACVTLVVLALFMGIARNHFYFERSGQINFGLDKGRNESIFESTSRQYGTLGLQTLVEGGVRKLSYGTTFLSLLTQPIPRSFYPAKLETGGVFYTRYYLNDQWRGASYATPSIIGEFVIAFGWAAGLIAGYTFYFIVWKNVMRLYNATWSYRQVSRALFCILLIAHLRLLLIANAFLVGEFTNVVFRDVYFLTPVLFLLWRRLYKINAHLVPRIGFSQRQLSRIR